MKKIFFLIFLLLKFSFLPAQSTHLKNHLHFDHSGTENGLSFPTVNCLLQDSHGFIWAGTSNGLNRYDGNSFLIFRHDNEKSNSLVSNDVRSLAEDSEGNIWIGTVKGVSELNPFSNKFLTYHHDNHDSTSLSHDYINHVFADGEKNIWIGNPGGLDKFDAITHKFHPLIVVNPEGKHLTASSFCEKDPFQLWIGTNDGLLLLNKKKKVYEYYKPFPDKNFLITSLCRDTLGNLWIGTWADGAFLFDVESKTFTQYKYNFTSLYTSAANIVLSVEETARDPNDFTLWFGTTEGLARLEIKNKTYPSSFSDAVFYSNDPQDPYSLSSNSVNDLFSDNNGILWMATSEGLDKMIPNLQAFITREIQGSVFKTLAKKNERWVTTWYGNGIIHFDSSWNEIEHFKRVPPSTNTLDNGQVSNICRDENHLLWMATFHGLVNYDEERKRFTNFLHDDQDSASLSENRITSVFHDSKNRLWVGSYSKGLNLKLPGTKRFIHFFHDDKKTNSLSCNKIWMITEDKSHHIWIGTDYGLSRYDESSHSFANFFSDEKTGTTISCVYADAAGRIWVSTKEALYLWNPQKNDFKSINQPAELNDAMIYSILDDDEGRIWLATQRGLIQYNPVRHTMLLFDKRDGLPFDDLSGSFDKDSLNRFYIGGSDKLVTFNPNDLNFKVAMPQVCITNLKISEQALAVDSVLKLKSPLCLSYNQNMLTFEFTAPNFIHSERIKFAYMMEGLDKEWNETGSNRMAIYSSVPPGNYIFRVRATAINGEWSDKEAVMPFIILPPFWKTWWFILLTFISLALIVFLFVRYRINNIRKRADEKTLFNTQLAEVEMKALRAQMNPHFIFNALNSIQECVVTNQNDAAYHYLSKFSKLVRLILENSEQSLVPIRKEMDALKLYLDLESLRFQNFSYTITIDNSIDQDEERIPSMLIQPFAENSIKHGLATKEGNRFLKIQLHKNKYELTCIVQDNGIGRKEAGELKNTFRNGHQSRGMKITEDRIRLIGAKNKIDMQLLITDLFDDEKRPEGTRVEIKIPHDNELTAP